MKINIKFDGDALKKKLTQAATEAAKKHIRAKASRQRCPVHGETASVKFVGATGPNFKTVITGCCDEFVAKVQRGIAK